MKPLYLLIVLLGFSCNLLSSQGNNETSIEDEADSRPVNDLDASREMGFYKDLGSTDQGNMVDQDESLCGNRILDDTEEDCDGELFGIQNCESLGYLGGQLLCDATCKFDLSQCHTCGNGNLDTQEECDGQTFGDETCSSRLGMLSSGALACRNDCTIDSTQCKLGYTKISAGSEHNCVLRSDQKILCWGKPDNDRTIPPTTSATDIELGSLFSCSLTITGTIDCWGTELADPAIYKTPTISGRPSGKFLNIGLGLLHGCAVDENQDVTCWGKNTRGESDPPLGMKFKEVDGGIGHSCGIRDDDTIICWGSPDGGRLAAPSGDFENLNVGWYNSCATSLDTGLVSCWGRNSDEIPQTNAFKEINHGDNHACGITENDDIECWGLSDFGQITAPVGKFLSVSAGRDHNCALAIDQTIVCWGSDVDSQLGPTP